MHWLFWTIIAKCHIRSWNTITALLLLVSTQHLIGPSPSLLPRDPKLRLHLSEQGEDINISLFPWWISALNTVLVLFILNLEHGNCRSWVSCLFPFTPPKRKNGYLHFFQLFCSQIDAFPLLRSVQKLGQTKKERNCFNIFTKTD